MRHFSEALQLAEKLNDEAASEYFRVTRDASGATHLDNPLLSRADEHDVPLYIETEAEHTRGQKQNATFISHAFYSFATSLLQGLRSIHSTACEKYPTSFNAFLLVKIPQTRTSALPVREVYPNKLCLFSYDPGDKRRTLAACVKARSQRAARAVKKPFIPGKEVVSSARAAKKSSPPSSPENSRRLGKHASIGLSWLDLRLARRAFFHKKNRGSHLRAGEKVMTSVVVSGTARKGESLRPRREGRG